MRAHCPGDPTTAGCAWNRELRETFSPEVTFATLFYHGRGEPNEDSLRLCLILPDPEILFCLRHQSWSGLSQDPSKG